MPESCAERRRRIHICPLPMDDLEENAVIVNSLKRRSDVIVAAVSSLVCEPDAAVKIGENGRRRVTEHYLAPNYLTRQLGLVSEVLASAA